MKNQRKKFNGRMKMLLASVVFVLGMFALSSFMDTPESALGGITIATILPMGIMRDPGTGLAGGQTEAEQKAALMNEIKTGVAAKFAELIEANATLKELQAFKAAYDGAKTPEEMTKLKSDLEALGLKVNALKESHQEKAPVRRQSMADALVAGFKSFFEVADGEYKPKAELANMIAKKSGTGSRLTIETKAAATMTTANVDGVGTDSVPFTLADIEAGLTRIVRRMPFIIQLTNRGGTTGNVVQYVEQRNADPGEAGMTAEGAAKTQTDFDLAESRANVETVTAYIKVSRQMLADVAFIEAEIRNELVTLIELKMDQQVLSGDGTSPNISGILDHAITDFVTAVTGSTFENSTAGANRFDVLRVAIAIIQSATPNGPFNPTDIVMNPIDLALMDLAKSSDGHYILPPFKSSDGTTVKGLPITANVGVTEGNFLVGDFTKSNVRIRENIMLSVGMENDDFTKNLVTILGEARLTHYIKNNHLKAFVEGTFSTAMVILDPALPT